VTFQLTGALSAYLCAVERIVSELAPDPATFTRHFNLVQAYVRSEAGSHTALMAAANEDPEAMTTSIVALGAVLLDVASGAFNLTPEQMLDKVADGVGSLTAESPVGPAL
jgi:hypothetical protein